jgi:hypothetical protein
MKQKDVLQECEGLDLNINVGIGSYGGIYEFDNIGDYTIEDLNGYEA